MIFCRRSAPKTAELWIWSQPSVTTTTPESTSFSSSLTPYAGIDKCSHCSLVQIQLCTSLNTPAQITPIRPPVLCCLNSFSFLHTRLRTATLRHDTDGQAVLLNLLLRNYLNFNLYDQAEKLVSKSVFPELANNNEWARYLYYTGPPEFSVVQRLV